MIEISNNCIGSLPPGFFSNFLIVIDWIHNSIYNDEKIFVNWNCGSNKNIWDEFFEQPSFSQDNQSYLKVKNYRSHYEKKYTIQNIDKKLYTYSKYNGWFCNNVNVYYDEFFQNLRDEFSKAFQKIKIKQELLNQLPKFNPFDKILGVAVRIPDHYSLGNNDWEVVTSVISPKDFYSKLSEEVINEYYEGKYDKIFVACDVQYFIDLVKNKIGEENLIINDYKRLEFLNKDWTYKNLTLTEEYRLVLIDCLCLSKCSMILGGSSNIFLSSLFIEPNLNFKLFNLLEKCYGL